MVKSEKKIIFRGRTRAKLSFDDGFAERPFYTIKAFNTEKLKGINMIELIENNFNISEDDKKKAFDETINELTTIPKKQKKVIWTRDEKGNIASPFRSKKWGDIKKV